MPNPHLIADHYLGSYDSANVLFGAGDLHRIARRTEPSKSQAEEEGVVSDEGSFRLGRGLVTAPTRRCFQRLR
jgi:hypothetical protein